MSEIKEKLYRLTVNDSTKYVGKPQYRAGEKAVLNFPLLSDVDISVTCDSVNIGRGSVFESYFRYEFIMPPHDVNVKYSTHGSMTKMSSARMNTSSVPDASSGMNNSSKMDTASMIVCPSCGHTVSNTDQYCNECGYKVK